MQSKPQWDTTSHLSEKLLSNRQRITSVGKDYEKREHSCTVGENVNGCGHYRNSREVPQKIKNRITIWSSNSTPGYFFKENKNTNSKRYMHTYVHCSIIYNNQDMEITYMSINRWMEKENVICLCIMEYY